MKNKRFLLGLFVIILIFGMTVVAYTKGIIDDVTDPALNGTWIDNYGIEQIFDNGKYEVSGFSKGIYSTSGGKITYQTTHISGFMMMGMGVFDMPESWYLEYYSENELKTVIKAYVIDKEIDVYIDAEIDEKIDEQLDEWFRNNKIFTEVTGTYSVNGNELTLTIPISGIGDSVTQTLTKK